MSSMTIGPIAGSAADPSERSALLFWMIFTGLSIFAVVLLWRYGLIRLMVISDRTYISSLIARALCPHLRPLLLADAGDRPGSRGGAALPARSCRRPGAQGARRAARPRCHAGWCGTTSRAS